MATLVPSLCIFLSSERLKMRTRTKTQEQVAEEVSAEHRETATATSDAELKEWSFRTYNDLQAANNAMWTSRAKAKELHAVREETRLAHRINTTPETTTAWRKAVLEADAATNAARSARDHRNYLSALSDLLSSHLRERRIGVVDKNNVSESVHNFKAGCVETTTAAPPSASADAPAAATAIIEGCPFCNHCYTVRDGTIPQLDADGNRQQLRKCMCREMAPPCKNCPLCKQNAALMTADGDEQLRMCREELHCEICACECPGVGKWIQGDENSRERFRDRTARRHAELSALLQGSWDDTTAGGGGGGSGAGTETAGPSMLRRLPADIKNQIIAARAAESLFTALDSAAGGEGGTGGARSSGAATTSAHGGTACGRMCCGEAITTVKRRQIETSTVNTEDHGRPRRRTRFAQRNTVEKKEVPKSLPTVENNNTAAADGAEGHHHNEGCGDHCNHHEHHEYHHHNHVHRCEHPHDECDSDCCSAISNA